MYDPTVGKWISADPIGFDGEDANLYRYVNNSPMNLVDPSGQEAQAPCANFDEMQGAYIQALKWSLDDRFAGAWSFKVGSKPISNTDQQKILGTDPVAFFLTYKPSSAIRKWLSRPIWPGGEKPKLILVHAVHTPGYTVRFDGVYNPPKSEMDFPKYPEYPGIKEDQGLTIVDSPYLEMIHHQNHHLTTCAVIEVPDPYCPGERFYFRLGCINYDWHCANKEIIHDGTTVGNGGKLGPLSSESPGETWNRALKNDGKGN